MKSALAPLPKQADKLRKNKSSRGFIRGLHHDHDETIAANTAQLFRDSVRKVFTDQKILLGSAWADKYRVMGTDSNWQRWDTNRTPYLREIAETLSSSDPAHQIVVIGKAAQMGASEVVLNEVLRRMHLDPCPMLFYMETDDKAKEWRRERLDIALANPPFQRRSHKVLNTTTYGRATLWNSGVGSSASLASKSAKLVVGDECARYPTNLGGEGDFLGLAMGRTKTYGKGRKIILPSTFTTVERGEGCFLTYFEAGDCREYYCPCPHCEEFFLYKMELLKRINEKEAAMACPHCGGLTQDGDERSAAIANGKWVPTKKRTNEHCTSYRINGLIVPQSWTAWIEFIHKQTAALSGTSGQSLQAFYNLELGLPYDEPEARTPSANALRAELNKREGYRAGIVPANAFVLTLAIDVQGNRLVYEVRAWGRALENWSIEWSEIPVRITETAKCVAAITELFTKDYKRPDGSTMRIWLGCMDCGYNQTDVLAVTDQFNSPEIKGKRYVTPFGSLTPIKGASRTESDKLILGEYRKQISSRIRHLRKFWLIGTDYAKAELYHRLNMICAGESDKITMAHPHFPVDYGDEYFEQLVAEQVVTTRHSKTNRLQRAFKLPNNTANEALDLYVYNRVAAEILNVRKFTEQGIANTNAWMRKKFDRSDKEQETISPKMAKRLAKRKQKQEKRRERRN